ncbi:MAG: YlxR family protein [Pseudomonadota bacterium]
MKKKHVPIRTCIGCGAKHPSHSMIRLKAVGGTVVRDSRQRTLPGRGCYVCRCEPCVEAALKKGSLARAFRRNIAYPPSKEGLLRGFDEKG